MGGDTSPDGETMGQVLPPARLTKDEFYGTFKMMFALPNMVGIPPFPLEALPIKKEEEDAARAASDAIYDIAAETPHLSWMIEPGSEWLGRLVAIGMFVGGKAMACWGEIVMRDAPQPPLEADPTGAPEKPSTPTAKSKSSPKGDASKVVHIK